MNNSLRTTMMLAALAAAVLPATASADDTIKRPGDHPKYAVEIEPHGLWGWDQYYGANDGFGVGARFSIPVTDNGFIPTLNNSVAVSFGADWLHYSGYCFGVPGGLNCTADANYVFFPVALQWNFFVAHQWSVFGEPGLAIYHAFFPSNYCNPAFGFHCTETGVWPVFYAGGRYHINEDVALVLRIGYPTFSFGVSFM